MPPWSCANLVESLKDPDIAVRGYAAFALAIIMPDEDYVPVFIRAFSCQRLGQSDSASEIIGEMGVEARAAIPALQHFVADRCVKFPKHNKAAAVLGTLDPQAATAALRLWNTPGGRK